MQFETSANEYWILSREDDLIAQGYRTAVRLSKTDPIWILMYWKGNNPIRS